MLNKAHGLNPMKQRILIPSLIFLFITSGLSLYHLYYLNGFNTDKHNLDLSEFKSMDLELNEEIFRFRTSMGANNEEIERAFERFKNQKNIVIDFLKEINSDLSLQIKFDEYFNKKQKLKSEIEEAVVDLKKNLDEINPTINSFPKLNIKFVVDGKDFYKELVINTHRFVLSPDKESTERFLEDRKILQQIKTYSKIENPDIKHLKELHDTVFEKMNLLTEQFNSMSAVTLEKEINTISQTLMHGIDENRNMKRNFLIMTMVTTLIYTIAIILFFNYK